MRRLISSFVSLFLVAGLILSAVPAAASHLEVSDYELARIAFSSGGGSNIADGIAYAALGACTEEEYQIDRCPRFPLEAHTVVFAFDESAVGTTIWMDSSAAGFAEVVEKITDGLQGRITPVAGTAFPDGTPRGAGYATLTEAAFFGAQAGSNGFDLEFFHIDQIGFEVTAATIDHDGVSTNFTFSGFFVIEGRLTKAGCKDTAWQAVTRADGTEFKNQGDCVQYTNTDH